MATINLGRVKPVFRGAYAGGTAYVVDDIVTYSNETYICILASTGNLPTDTTYWTKLAAKGTDGTDVSTTLTTQGDLLYRDGSGLQRLGAGTSGQVLQSGGTGANPSWVDASGGGILQYKITEYNDGTQSISSNWPSFGTITSLSVSITPTSASSKILISLGLTAEGTVGYRAGGRIYRNGSTFNLPTNVGNRVPLNFAIHSAPNSHRSHHIMTLDAPATTSALTYTVGVGTESTGGTLHINRNDNDNNAGDHGRTTSYISAMEIDGGIL